MKKDGFVFVETIVAIVVLTSSLLLLYSSFTKILQLEKTRVYYDDINYIYRTWYIKNKFKELKFNNVIRDTLNNADKYFVTVGTDYQNLFDGYNSEKNYITNLLEDYEVRQIIVVEVNEIENIKECTPECSLDSTCEYYDKCNDLYTNLSDEMISYLKTVSIDVSCELVFIVEYRTCNSDNTNCKNYYSWVSV